MNLDNYMKAGYASLFIESTEIKRAVKTLNVDTNIFKIKYWNAAKGLYDDETSNDEINQMSILEEAAKHTDTMFVLENYDFYLNNPMVIQLFLNNYEHFKFNRVFLVIVGVDIKSIPIQLKELIPIIDFPLPNKDKIHKLITDLATGAEEQFNGSNDKTKDYDFSVTDEIVDACCGMSVEEIENVMALSLIEKKKFDLKTIIDRKRQVVRSTGFMDFIQPEPLSNLGGLDLLKEYIIKRHEAFKPENEGKHLPKLRAVLIVGFPGVGKSLCAKTISSIFDWPAIVLDIGSLKGGLVGDTETNTRLACKTIDSIGRSIVLIDKQ